MKTAITLKAIFLISVSFLTNGCATKVKDWSATGGSRMDGTVELSYTFGIFETAVGNPTQGYILALEKCMAWGYDDARPFGGTINSCASTGTSGCNVWRARAVYQCIGTPE